MCDMNINNYGHNKVVLLPTGSTGQQASLHLASPVPTQSLVLCQ